MRFQYHKIPVSQLVKILCHDCIDKLSVAVHRNDRGYAESKFEPCLECKAKFEKQELAISDSGPNHELHVYNRKDLSIVWRRDAKGDVNLHDELLHLASEVVLRGYGDE
jgi:hypothetical protein